MLRATLRVEGAQGSSNTIEKTRWSKLYDECQDKFTEVMGVPTFGKFIHQIELTDNSL